MNFVLFINLEETTMPFPIDSLYDITLQGKETVRVKVIDSPAAFHKILVQEIVSMEKHYLVEYLINDAEIRETSESKSSRGIKI